MSRERVFEYHDHWLVTRPDTPNYYVYWLEGTRRIRQVSTRTNDLELAKERLIELANQRRRPEEAPAEEVAIREMLRDYIHRDLRHRPSRVHAMLAEKHLTRYFGLCGARTVADLSLDTLEDYIAWRRQTGRGVKGRPLSNGTIARELSVLKAALRRYWQRGLIISPPYVPSLPPPPPRQRFLRANEAARLIEACELPHLRLFVLIALHTLQRPGAVLGLRTEQVYLLQNRIDFLPPGQQQSHKRKPVVPITRTLLPHLERAVKHSVSGYVIEHQGERVLSVKKSFKRSCELADLVDVTPYTLRHTGATLLAASGVPMRQIAGMLGHTTQKTTELYAKHSPDFLAQASEALDGLFPGTRLCKGESHDSERSTALQSRLTPNCG